MIKKTGVVKTLANIKICLGTGMGYVSDLKYPVLLAITLKVYLPNANNITLGLIALAAMIIMAVVGWFDLKYIHLAQTTAEIITRKYNPYFTELEKKVSGGKVLNNR